MITVLECGYYACCEVYDELLMNAGDCTDIICSSHPLCPTHAGHCKLRQKQAVEMSCSKNRSNIKPQTAEGVATNITASTKRMSYLFAAHSFALEQSYHGREVEAMLVRSIIWFTVSCF